MRTNHILYCFGDKRCKIVGHIPRINCSAMIAVFVYTLEASNCTLPVYSEYDSNVKCICLIKGVSYVIKIMRLTDEYALFSEVDLTSRLYGMHSNMFPRQLVPKTSWFKLDCLASGYKFIITPLSPL